jgi:4-methyl-5(b-hydroxyethyl)-thiazole monophosphate biosynthesis
MIKESIPMPKVLVPLANGTEEMEAVIVIDILRRAQWQVTTAGIEPGLLTASRGVRLMPDTQWADITPSDFDILMIPGGGPGVEQFLNFTPLLETIRQFCRADKWVGAICAAPLTLQAAGVLTGKKATCHPAVADWLTVTPRLNTRTVVDGHLVTSQGAGTTFDFALTLVRLVDTPAKAQTIADSIGLNT